MSAREKTSVLYFNNHASPSTSVYPERWKLIRNEQFRLFSFWLGAEGEPA